MLAEKRCKQKWSTDPRNTRWSEDRSKYGYRMLQRMGWKDGQGLGKEGRGGREHVKVTRRCDNAGVGYTGNRDECWIEHQESFDQILANLNAEKGDGTEVIRSACGETKSLLSTAIHTGRAAYKKRLLSKDLSVASSDDLNCVMGKRGRKEKVKEKRNDSGRHDSTKEELNSAPVLSHGVATITQSVSIQEYFAAKLADTGGTGDSGLDTVKSGGVCGDSGDVSVGCDRLQILTTTDTDCCIQQPQKKRTKKSRKKRNHQPSSTTTEDCVQLPKKRRSPVSTVLGTN